jgi:hypothetical protein
MKRKYSNGSIGWAVHEVYYNDEGKPDGWTKNPITMESDESVDDLIEMVEKILKDIKRTKDDILDYDADPEPGL